MNHYLYAPPGEPSLEVLNKMRLCARDWTGPDEATFFYVMTRDQWIFLARGQLDAGGDFYPSSERRIEQNAPRTLFGLQILFW